MTRCVLLAGILALGGSGCSSAAAPSGLLPDLNLTLRCKESPSVADEVKIEKDLYSAGFDVLNRARLARELRLEFSPPIMINAIDRNGRLVSVTGIASLLQGQQRQWPYYLAISLYSHPPTSRDARLERSLENMTAGIPKCSPETVERHSNSASAESLYREIATQTRGWFGEAEEQAPSSDAHRVH